MPTTLSAVKEVKFGFSENNDIPEGAVMTLEDANKLLAQLYAEAELKNEPGYDKTDIEVMFEDGEIYGLRYDIGSDLPTIQDHAIAFVERVVERNTFVSRNMTADQKIWFIGMKQRFLALK